MTLHSFDQNMNPFIKERAHSIATDREYRDFHKEDNTYRMTVSGFFDYHPEVTLGKKDKILSHTCECHHHKESVCQHVGALLYVIRMRSFSYDEDDIEQAELKTMLMKHSKERLIEIITSLTRSDPGFAQTLRQKAGSKEERLEAFKDEVNASLELYLDKLSEDGPDDFSHLILYGVYETLEEVQRMKEVDFAFSLLVMLFEELLDFEVMGPGMTLSGDLYQEIFVVLEEMMPEVVALDPTLKRNAFDELISLIEQFDSLLLEKTGPRVLTMLAGLAVDETKDVFLDKLRQYETYAKTESESDDLEMARLTFLQRFESYEAVETFIEGHMDNPMIRFFAIQKAMMDEDYETAANLAKEGMQEPSRSSWDPENFELSLLAAEIQLENHAEIKRILRKRLLLGEDWAYDPYISLFEGYEQDVEREDILDRLKSSNETLPAFVSICFIEERYEDVMTFIEKHPQEITYLHGYFPEAYSSRIDACFHEAILDKAQMIKTEEDEDDLFEMVEAYQEAFEDHALKVIENIRNPRLKKRLKDRFELMF